MAMLARAVSRSIPGSQVAFVRFATGTVVTLLALAIARVDLRPRRWGWLISRGIFGGLAVLLYFTSIEKVGVGVATLLNYTAPVWCLLFGWLFLKERPKRNAVIALGITMIGVFLVATGKGQHLSVGPWEILAVSAAVVSGMAITSIRATRRPTDDGIPSEGNWTVFASFTFVGTLVTLPAVAPPFGHFVSPTATQWILLVLCALLSVAAQLLMTSALREITATRIGILHELTVVITLFGGWIFFGESLTLRATLGSAITMGGVIWLVLSER